MRAGMRKSSDKCQRDFVYMQVEHKTSLQQGSVFILITLIYPGTENGTMGFCLVPTCKILSVRVSKPIAALSADLP